MKHITSIIEVPTIDGTHKPNPEQVRFNSEQRFTPNESGHVHTIGAPREVTRFGWVCSCGKGSGKCTFPTESVARTAGKTHEKQTRKAVPDKDAFTWRPETAAEKKLAAKAKEEVVTA